MTINDNDNDNDDDTNSDDNGDDSYSGDQHAPKVGGLLDSIILSTGHTKVLLDTWAA